MTGADCRSRECRLGPAGLYELRIGVLGFLVLHGQILGHLLVELTPFLLGPPELLDRGRKVEEMDGHYRCSGPEVGVADQGVELPPSFDQTAVDPG